MSASSFAVLTTIVGPLIYFFPAGLKTFLDSLVMLIALPVLTAVFGGFFFKHLPKYSAKVILALHVVCYGSFLLFLNSKFHYLYAVFVLLPVELLIMFIFNQQKQDKASGGMGTEGHRRCRSYSVEISMGCYRTVFSFVLQRFTLRSLRSASVPGVIHSLSKIESKTECVCTPF